MKNTEIRRLNLLALIQECGGQTALEKKCDVSRVHINQIVNKTPNRNGTPKGMGDAVAEKLEKCFGKPDGWMDVIHTEHSKSGEELLELYDGMNDQFKEILLEQARSMLKIIKNK